MLNYGWIECNQLFKLTVVQKEHIISICNLCLQAPEIFEITECMRHGIRPKEGYSECVRTFCLTLQFLKPRAYEYVREKSNKNLPHQSTIRSWYWNSNIDFSPGICNSALEVLRKVGAKMEADGTPLVCNVVFDEMAVR